MFVLTNNAIYNIKKDAIQRRIPLEKLDALTISLSSYEFVIHVKDENDYRYISYEMRSEIVEALLYVLFNVKRLCTSFPVYQVNNINLNQLVTTKADLTKKVVVRPRKELMRVMTIEDFQRSKQEQEERSTNMRKNTHQLYTKDV